MKISDLPGIALMLLIYSGPLLPLLTTVLFSRASQAAFQRNRIVLFVLTGLQALLFLPCLVSFACSESDDPADWIYWLVLPILAGILLFIAATSYAIRDFFRLRKQLHPHRAA